MANTTQEKTDDYFAQVTGDDWLAAQSSLCGPLIRSVFGYAGVLSSVSTAGIDIHPSVGNFWHAHSSVGVSPASLYASPSAWPFENSELDLVVLHHVLDFANDPHAVMRDSARIVKPGGYLMIIGFNPFSLQGLRRFTNQWRSDAWHYDAVRVGRLRDWFRLLGFSECGLRFGRVFPWSSALSVTKRFKFRLKRGMPFGCYYAIIARKQTYSGLRLRSSKQSFDLGLGAMSGGAAMRDLKL